MNRKWQGLRMAMVCCAAIGWWGLWYPELSTAADTYAIVLEDGTVLSASEVVECEFGEQYCEELLQADNSQIRFRSRFLQWLEEYFEKVGSEDDFRENE